MAIVIAMPIRENGMCSIWACAVGMSRTTYTGERQSRLSADCLLSMSTWVGFGIGRNCVDGAAGVKLEIKIRCEGNDRYYSTFAAVRFFWNAQHYVQPDQRATSRARLCANVNAKTREINDSMQQSQNNAQ